MPMRTSSHNAGAGAFPLCHRQTRNPAQTISTPCPKTTKENFPLPLTVDHNMLNIVKDHHRGTGAFFAPVIIWHNILCCTPENHHNIGGMNVDHNRLDRGDRLVRCCGGGLFPPRHSLPQERSVKRNLQRGGRSHAHHQRGHQEF